MIFLIIPKLKRRMEKALQRISANKNLERFSNGFVVFTPTIFEMKKKEIDSKLK